MAKENAALRALRSIAEAIPVALTARKQFGNEAHDGMIVEECGELLTAVARLCRGRFGDANVNEEVADVLLVLLGRLNPEVIEVLLQKTQRLKGFLG